MLCIITERKHEMATASKFKIGSDYNVTLVVQYHTWYLCKVFPLKVYHRTFHATEIMRDGFKDGIGSYLTDRMWEGVWFSDEPLDFNEGAKGDTLLRLDIPSKLFEKYEWVEENKGYREALIPSVEINKYARSIKVVNDLKFHFENGRWLCNICNDVGSVKDGKMICQGCKQTEG
jgi:hypothetical protein